MSFNYNPSEYWHERGKVYQKNFKYDRDKRLQEKLLIKHLNDNIFTSQESVKSVLELGCGFGRVTKLLLTEFPVIKEYLAVDLSPHQLENAKKYIGSNNDKITFLLSDIQNLDTNNKKYDLVIISEVLLHIKPDEIDPIIKKIISLSKKHVVNIDWYEDTLPLDYKKRATYNFIHQYEELYKKYTEPSTTTTIKRIPIRKKNFLSSFDTRQSIFHVILEENLH
jgi:ubiquinone/menaquinone biosynthesis C-methylase UbiE